MHEVGGAYGLDKDGKQIVVEALPGKARNPCDRSGPVSMDPLAALNTADIGRIVVLQGTFHSHSGLSMPNPNSPQIRCTYRQPPSGADMRFAAAYGTGDQNYVFAFGEARVWQYSGTGISQATSSVGLR